jgi:predicted amidohydrolase
MTSSEQPHTLTVGLLQAAPNFGRVDENLSGLRALRSQIGEVDLLLTPELALNGYGFGASDGLNPLDPRDPRLGELGDDRTATGIGYAEQNPGGLPRNGYLLTDPRTGTRSVQHKIHPVSYAPWNEHLGFTAGDSLATTSVGGAELASIICNDMWHPVVPWLAAQAGAEVIIVPVASMDGADPDGVQRTWEVILEHTAVLLQCYVVFINRCGTDGGARFWGGSRVLGPDGTLLTILDDTQSATTATLDLRALRERRARTPLLAESRPLTLSQPFRVAPPLPMTETRGPDV